MNTDLQRVKKHPKSIDFPKKRKLNTRAHTGLDQDSEEGINSVRTPYQKKDEMGFDSTKRTRLESSEQEAVFERDSGGNLDESDDETRERDELQKGSSCESDDETVHLQAEDKEELNAVKEELSHMSFEELHQLKEKLGTKVFNQVVHGTTGKSRPAADKERKKASRKTDYKRSHKSRPMEMSSKKTVSRFRNIIPVKKKVSRDPRFDDLSGEFNDEYFQKSYSFLNDVKTREKQKLEKQLRKTKDDDTKVKVKSLLNRMTQQQKSEMDKAKKLEQAKEWTRKEKELVEQGKKPFFLKKSDKKKLELADKYRELKQSGTLDKYLSKKRKKNSQKQRKKFLN